MCCCISSVWHLPTWVNRCVPGSNVAFKFKILQPLKGTRKQDSAKALDIPWASDGTYKRILLSRGKGISDSQALGVIIWGGGGVQ